MMDLNQPRSSKTLRLDEVSHESDEEEPVIVVPLGTEVVAVKKTDPLCDGKDDHSQYNEGSQAVNDQVSSSGQLEQFRQQWQDELQKKPGSRSQSPHIRSENNSVNQEAKQSMEEMKENQARDYFLQGMEAEDDGMLAEAIYYYKKALQLVPDIESKLGSVFTRSPRDRMRQESESSIGSELEEDLLSTFDNLNLKEHGLCLQLYEQRMSHISVLPVELIINILHWVVSSDLDLRSLEMFSMVCKGFYMCARDETLWKLACEKIWGVNLGSHKKYGSSWRRMLIERPHLMFDGCYISKVAYVRQGEQGLDQFYRPFHLVEYYRYVRFFPDGVVLMHVSPDDPLQTLPKLRQRYSKAVGLLKGHYKLLEHKVTCVMKRVKTYDSYTYKYKRHRQGVNQNDTEPTYCVVFDISTQGRKPNTKLDWCSYNMQTVHRATGQCEVNNFDLNKRTFPPLIFSRVKSYTSMADEQLA